ncbi:baseplate J/gp47 family protein [Virgibacillus halodenitrificans]|uniref:baseplate J/gp47 family protein n=1 Tax=Virgibacillus halodenitrificans TaxID=1482 RepID=UPI000EF4E276|nr:baseplate J/gp47 family protein [Virgibacillus halodenitrificans]
MKQLELPYYLEDVTEETIMDRMLESLPDDIDKSEGSYIWDSLMPVAIEVAKTAEWCREVLNRGFTSSTFGVYLDLKAAERGLARQAAVKAIGYVSFTGTEGTIIPVGTRIATPSDNQTPSVEFETTKQATIDVSGEVVVPIEAIEEGTVGVVGPGTISIIVSSITGVSSVMNKNSTFDGFDEESDESLRQRILNDNKQAEGVGNSDDYITWAQEISSVGKVIVEPIWQGINTVRVIILNRDGAPASVEQVAEIQQHLDPTQDGSGKGRAPIGAIVTVATVETLAININVPNLQNAEGYTIEQTQQNVINSLNKFFNSVDAGGVIRIKEVASSIIHAPGVLDFGDITLNNGTVNISLALTQVATTGSVTFI